MSTVAQTGLMRGLELEVRPEMGAQSLLGARKDGTLNEVFYVNLGGFFFFNLLKKNNCQFLCWIRHCSKHVFLCGILRNTCGVASAIIILIL